MHKLLKPWDYLILTASNEEQAAAYKSQLQLRQKLGLIQDVKQIMTVSDPGGRRIGSGGSTIFCIMKVLQREVAGCVDHSKSPSSWQKILQRLRILIIHAGGDSRRLPAYGPYGKIFMPLPGESDSALGTTLFDRQLPVYLKLPVSESGEGQIVITTGDVLLDFNPEEVCFAEQGITCLGCLASPDMAKNHGVFCSGHSGIVRMFLQKPSIREQSKYGAVNRYGQSLLDIGVMNLDSSAAVKLLQLCEVSENNKGKFVWDGPLTQEITASGLDLYREICCAMGKDEYFPHYHSSLHAGGSKISKAFLEKIFKIISEIPFHVYTLSHCYFLHFGTMHQLIESGTDLLSIDHAPSRPYDCLSITNEITDGGHITGVSAWVEGCRIKSGLTLGGENVVVGLDIEEPLSIPRKCCLDVIKDSSQNDKQVWFVRIYGIDDKFKDSVERGAKICSIPATDWIKAVGASNEDVWPKDLSDNEKNIWNSRIFPAVSSHQDYMKWLWMFDPAKSSTREKQAWITAERYSLEEIANMVDQGFFYERRVDNRVKIVCRSIRWMFRFQSSFSAEDLAFIFRNITELDRLNLVMNIIKEAYRQSGKKEAVTGLERLEFSRVIHSLGSAICKPIEESNIDWEGTLCKLNDMLPGSEKSWLESIGLGIRDGQDALNWGNKAKDAAFENISQTIVLSKRRFSWYPKNALRSDEIIWGRAPARLDLGGGWTDTPPYSLEYGGCVINAAVDLNGQPPIHVYLRSIDEPEIRINSIDYGVNVSIKELDELLDYREDTSKFGLAKAALALSGFSPENASWPEGTRTLEEMLRLFGGGIELTTLAAIPGGSGLGTSSIMGAVLISVINRMLGKELTNRELFHCVLKLEQELTTGGGWQDQIGGTVDSVKVINTGPGMIPDPRIHYVPSDVLNPKSNDGQTLLYYTGLRRLAKNILRNVVGNYLDHNRGSMATLRKLHKLPPLIMEAMASKNMKQFGEMIDLAWRLNKQIDPDSTNPVIEEILNKFKPYMYGAKLLGAGGGGFLLVICKSPGDAEAARSLMKSAPPNPLARFFDYEINHEGLVVTVC